MREIKKHRICNDSSSFSCLPDELVLLILNKLIDLKTLCLCKLVFAWFNLIVNQVDTISFIAHPVDNPSFDSSDDGFHKKLLQFIFKPFFFLHGMNFTERRVSPPSLECESFRSAVKSLSRFRRLKFLCMELPSTHQYLVNCPYLYKWKVTFGSKVESFVILSPNSIYDTKGLSNVHEISQGQEPEDPGLRRKKVNWAIDSLLDAVARFRMLMGCVYDFPLLENILITQSGKRGSVSICGRNIVEMRKWLRSPTDSIDQKLSDSMALPCRMSQYYVPLLKLPVSGYLMKGVTLFLLERKDLQDGDDSFMNIDLDDFEDKEEAAYSEAVMEMLKKLRGRI